MKCDVAIVGEIYVDHVLTGFTGWPQPGEEVFSEAYVQEVGGGAAITACALSRLGRAVTLIGSIGLQERSWVGHRLASFGVADERLLAREEHTGVTISISNSSDRSFFTYVGANAFLAEHLTSEAVVERLAAHRHVHFAMPLSSSLSEHLLERLHAAGCTVSLDVGHQVRWLQDPENLLTCARVDYLLPNEREAKVLCDGDANAYLELTRQRAWSHGVIKLGANGAMMRTGNRTARAIAPPVQVIDTTGAGDAFNAGFIDGLLDGASDEECLRRGCVCGAMSTRVAGALGGLCNRQELQECYEQSNG